MPRYLRPLLLATLLAGVPPLYATETATPPTGYAQEAEQARTLLKNAVAYYREHGDAALPAFSRQGEFITGDLYVYVVSTDGIMLSSGGPSIRLIGRDVSSVLAPEQKAMFAKAMSSPEGEVQEGDYRWTSWDTPKEIRKHAYYERVGDRILAVGYYLPRSTPEQAQALLKRASDAMGSNPQETLHAINNLDPAYYQDDLYVLVSDLKNQRMVAHGFNRRLVGTDFNKLQAADGRKIGEDMLKAVSNTDHAEFSYAWRNPVTGRTENKTSYLQKNGDYLIAVGYYSK